MSVTLAEQVFGALVDWPVCGLCHRQYRPRHKTTSYARHWHHQLTAITRPPSSKTFSYLCLDCNRQYVPCARCGRGSLVRYMAHITLEPSQPHKFLCSACYHRPGQPMWYAMLDYGRRI
jgi:hypothetical protein